MIRKSWRKENDPRNLLRMQEDVVWWKGFQEKIQVADLSDEDEAYLGEIESDSEDENENQQEMTGE